ncbi:MAG: DJ-1/PfpI family protein [Mariprofundales bacterium]|nr:DJ-1/PfpI family protein [Mariprofundales bacterium]
MQVIIPFSEGFEEIECLTVVDVLRRAEVPVTLASLDGGAVTGRSNIVVQPDAALDAVIDQKWDLVVLPGGLPNAFILRDDVRVRALVQRIKQQQGLVSAICAAPIALAAYGVLGGCRVTSYPGTQGAIADLAPEAVYCDDVVVEDGFLITSRGPGTAMEFSLRLVTRLCGEEKSNAVRQELISA